MSGYFRQPTIYRDAVVFLCEDDLWSVAVEGGIARRLTSTPGVVSAPSFSPDGELLAFVGCEEGPSEIYCMPALGGEARRLTCQGASAVVSGWQPDGDRIVYASSAGVAYGGGLWTVRPEGGSPERLPYGPETFIAYGDRKAVVLGRCARDPARWKRYRGGTAGQLWIDPRGSGKFRQLSPADGNFSNPMWISGRVYFISDHEGIGNVYSCTPSGEDVQRHTHQEEYYCRNASTDGRRIVYHAGGDLFVLDPSTDEERQIDVDLRSPRVQRQRKFVDASKYLKGVDLHPDGHALAMTVRGKLFSMANWEGAVRQHGERDGVRYRLSCWLRDGKRLVTVSDADGEERLEVHWVDGSKPSIRLNRLDIGRATSIDVSPKKDQIVLTNHRCELLLVDLARRSMKKLDTSENGFIYGIAWSPDGRWVAYGFPSTQQTCSIKICRPDTGASWLVTPPEFNDVAPSWDPEGKYLYFLSLREFNPVYDDVHFDLGFPQAMRPLLVTLRKDLASPFVPVPRPLQDKGGKAEESGSEGGAGKRGAKGAPSRKSDRAKADTAKVGPMKSGPIAIDFEGIEKRVVAFPYPEGHYGNIQGIEGKALFTVYPVEGAVRRGSRRSGDGKGVLHVYDFKEQKKDVLVKGISDFTLSMDRKALAYLNRGRIRVIKAGDKPEQKPGSDQVSRATGWVDLKRIRTSVVPLMEWRQMYREAWRLQKCYFWTENMSAVDWDRVYQRYLPLLDRVATRLEFSDLMWEMQGELGTSHCYEFGGDYRAWPNYAQGFLGADFTYDNRRKGYLITHVASGDAWEESSDSPLNEPGIGVKEGDVLLAISGQSLSRERGPGELLVNTAGQEVDLTVQDGKTRKKRTVTVKALRSEGEVRYREWVCKNRAQVHEKTEDKVGYVHIPDMMGRGYAEFHRGYLAELDRLALIVDVRYNSGGHVSPLILEKLARKRVAYTIHRWRKPSPYPRDSILGPRVALTNEYSGSDGDIFCHCFKLMQIGPLVGKRTWGGVVGISPHDQFVDGGGTTQPEHSYWFQDVGWGVENYGTDPDIDVDFKPQDYAAGRDPQLDRAIAEILRLMDSDPPELPDFGDRPELVLPELPKKRRARVKKG
jgi:tricorn protease